jgi:outer membrane protein TolC
MDLHLVLRMPHLLAVLAVASVLAPRTARAEGEAISLARAIEIGRRAAPELREAKTNADSEYAQDDVARSAYYPSLVANFASQGTAVRGTQPLPPPSNGVFSYVAYEGAAAAGVTAQWTLYDFGKTAGAVANADAQVRQAVATVGATDITVVGNVATAYMNVVYAEKVRDVTRATLEQRERLVLLAKGLMKSGLQPPLEELRASARAESSRVDLANAEGAVLDARAVLSALLGFNPSRIFRVSAPHLARLPLDPGSAAHLADRLPSVVAAYELVDAKRGVEDSNRAQYLPTIALSATGQYTWTRYDTERSTETTANAVAGITVTENLFEPAIAPSIAVAHANAENALATADQTRRDAREAAVRAVLALASAERAEDHAHKSAQSAAGVMSIVQARYLQGISSPLELIDAEGAESDSRLAEAQAEMATALAAVGLYIATGRRFEEQP